MAPAYGLHDSLWQEEQTIQLDTTLYHPSLHKNAGSAPGDYELSPQLCWDGSVYKDETSYVLELSDAEQQEIHQAVQAFYELDLNGEDVGRANFPLPTLGPKLDLLAREIHQGRGFSVIRGLNPDDLTVEDNVIAFLGLSSYIGDDRGRQTDDGKIFAHLRNPSSLDVAQGDRPLKYSNRTADFHNDIGCDILAMHARSISASGGDHLVASSAHILQVIRSTRPDVADELLKPDWPFDLRRRWATTTQQPVFYQNGSQVLSTLFPDALLGLPGVPRTEVLPSLTAAQREALDMVQAVAERDCVALRTVPGDFVFVNNLGLVHGRQAFEDSEETQRYLVRLWLRNKSLAWTLPEHMQMANWMSFDDHLLPQEYNIVPHDAAKFRVYERITP